MCACACALNGPILQWYFLLSFFLVEIEIWAPLLSKKDVMVLICSMDPLSTEWLAYSVSHVRTYFAGVRWAMLQMMIAVMKKPLKFQIISLHEPRWFSFNTNKLSMICLYDDALLILLLSVCQRSLARSAYNRGDYETSKIMWYVYLFPFLFCFYNWIWLYCQTGIDPDCKLFLGLITGRLHWPWILYIQMVGLLLVLLHWR